MTPEQAKLFCDINVAVLKNEQIATKRCIAAVPDDKGDYAPHPASMKALDLAWHLAASEMWFLDGVTAGKFEFGGDASRPAGIDTGKKVAEWYDKTFAEKIAQVEALSPEHLAQNVQFAMFNEPCAGYLSFCNRHSVHHRGQLSAYLRPMGAKVPSIYGGSADEPMEMPAQADAAAQA